MSVRQAIVDAIKAALERISPENGFHTGAGRDVYVWRLADLPNDSLPGIVIRDTTDPMDDQGVIDRVDHLLTVEIEGVAKATTGSTAETQARLLLADILKALGAANPLSGFYDMRVKSTNMVVIDVGQRSAGALITIEIKYRTARWGL